MVDYFLVRVSSDEQAKGGLSIQAQIQELQKFSEKYPDKIFLEENVFRAEGLSGGFKTEQEYYKFENNKFIATRDLKDRPDLIKFLQKCKSSDRLFFTKYDRLSRSFSFLEELIIYLRKLGVEVCPLNDNNEDIVRQVFSVFGQLERTKTIGRVADVQRSMFERGIHPNKPPTGYDKNIKDKLGKLKYPKLPEGLLINIEEAEMVKDIYNMTINGIGYKEICAKHEIFPQQYYNIIKNEIYYGIIRYKKEQKIGIHTPLITKEMWQKANKKT